MVTQQPEPFSVQVDDQDGRLVVRPVGELDLATVPELEGVVLPPLEAGRTVVLDLRGLEFLDSSGVRTILEAQALAVDGDGRFSVVRPHEGSPVWRVLEVSGVDRALEIEDDVA